MEKACVAWVGAVLLLPTILVAGADKPPTAIRWDGIGKPPPESTPATYTLRVPLCHSVGIDVDGCGSIYVLDDARSALVRFSATGELEKLWPLERHNWSFPAGPLDMCVLRDGTTILGPTFPLPSIRRIGPSPLDDVTFPWKGSGALIAATEDRSFYIHVGERKPGESRWMDSEIYACTPDGRIRTHWSCGGRIAPIAAGPDGLIYAAREDEPAIDVYDRDGKRQRRIDLEKVIGKGDFGPWRMAIDTNGDIYFPARGEGSDEGFIYRVDKRGRPLARWIPEKAPPLPHGGGGTFDIAVRNGLVYILYYYIYVYTPDGRCVARYVPQHVELNLPTIMAVTEDGSCCVVQHGLANALMYDAAGKLLGPMPDYSQFTSLAARPGGGYYVSSYTSAGYRVDAFDGQGKTKVLYVLERGEEPNHSVHAIGVDPGTGNIWGLTNRGLVIIGPDGKLVKRFDPNPDIGQASWSTRIGVDPTGFLYLADPIQHCILKVGFDGKLAAKFGKEGLGLGDLRLPEAPVVDSQGRVYIADSGNSRIQVFSREGEALGVWGRRGSGDGELDRPLGLAIGPNNTLWIADTFNDRIVKVPLDRLWKEITTDIKPEPVVEAPKKEPVPSAGQVTVSGIVIAGSDDLTDVIYIESPDRSWGAKVTLPTGIHALRGEKCKISGTLELKERAAKHILAKSVEKLAKGEKLPGPVGMANLYVGDGYKFEDKPIQLSNLGLLVRTWGRVVSVEPEKGRFTINDGSYTDKRGLMVYAGDLRERLIDWPKAGQYVGVTGVSVTMAGADGSFGPGVRIRSRQDIQVLKDR